MRHGFTRITGLTLAVLLIGSVPASAGGYKHKRPGGDAQGVPPTSGALNADPSVDGQVDPNVRPPEEPSASPRTETEPGARDHQRHPVRPAPRSDDTARRPDAQSPRSHSDVQPPRRDGAPQQGEAPRPRLAPGQPEQPLGSYKL
jgi:hypothetical protein